MKFNYDLDRLLKHSEVLSEIFEIPASETSIVEGTHEYPLVVPGITSQEFERFLNWMDHT